MTKQEREARGSEEIEKPFADLPLKKKHEPAFWAALGELLESGPVGKSLPQATLLEALDINPSVVQVWKDNTPVLINETRQIIEAYRLWLLDNARAGVGYRMQAMTNEQDFWASDFANELLVMVLNVLLCQQLQGWENTAEFYLYLVFVYGLGREVNAESHSKSPELVNNTIAFALAAQTVQAISVTPAGNLAIQLSDGETTLNLELGVFERKEGKWEYLDLTQPQTLELLGLAQGTNRSQSSAGTLDTGTSTRYLLYLEASQLAVELEALTTNVVQFTYHTGASLVNGELKLSADGTSYVMPSLMGVRSHVPLRVCTPVELELWETLVNLAILVARKPEDKLEATQQIDQIISLLYPVLYKHFPGATLHVKASCAGCLAALLGYLDSEDKQIDSKRSRSYKTYLRSSALNSLKRSGLIA